MSLARWLTLGSFSVAVIAAILLTLGGSTDVRAPSPASASADAGSQADTPRGPASHTSSASTTSDAPDSGAAVPAPSATSESGANDSGDSTASPTVTPTVSHSSATPTATDAGSTSSPQPVPAGAQYQLRIPALAVDAAVTPLGFDGAGGAAVPTTAGGVGWYEFSAQPGAPGNAVLGGHLNWRGSRGVFDRLDELSLGDMIFIDTAEGEIAYQVVGSFSVTAHTPFIDILGERSGPSTLTLFTCGGTFSSAAGEYDERLVVNAVRV